MKAITKIILILVISLMAAACATTPVTLPEKYNLDNELVEVTQIYKFREISWEKVDNQSIILRTRPSDYYLIVLLQPSHSLVFSETIGISDTGDMIKAGYDNVVVEDSGGTNSYIIHKIYKLEDRHQAQEIKERLKIDGLVKSPSTGRERVSSIRPELMAEGLPGVRVEPFEFISNGGRGNALSRRVKSPIRTFYEVIKIG